MDCNEAGKVLMAFVDDELDAPTSHEVDRHVGGCGTCTEEVATLRALDARIRGTCRADLNAAMSAGFAARLEGLIAPEPKSAAAPEPARARSRFPVRMVVAAAAALLAAVLVIGLLPGPTTEAYAQEHDWCLRLKGDWIRDPAELARICSDEAGSHALPPVLNSLGYRLDRGGVCTVGGVRHAHLVYTAQGREPVSVFVTRRYGGLGGRLLPSDIDRSGKLGVVRVQCPAGVEYVAVGTPELMERLKSTLVPR